MMGVGFNDNAVVFASLAQQGEGHCRIQARSDQGNGNAQA